MALMLVIYLILIGLNGDGLDEFDDILGPLLVQLPETFVLVQQTVRETASLVDLGLDVMDLVGEGSVFLDDALNEGNGR